MTRIAGSQTAGPESAPSSPYGPLRRPARKADSVVDFVLKTAIVFRVGAEWVSIREKRQVHDVYGEFF